jgi:hypothetical protein
VGYYRPHRAYDVICTPLSDLDCAIVKIFCRLLSVLNVLKLVNGCATTRHGPVLNAHGPGTSEQDTTDAIIYPRSQDSQLLC